LGAVNARTALGLLPVIVLVLGIVIYALRDLVGRDTVRYLPKPAWAVVIVLVSAPLGAIAYLVWGRGDDR
jgi:hypothetical protein